MTPQATQQRRAGDEPTAPGLLDIGEFQMSNTGATADFAVFSKWSAGFSVQYTGEMLTNRFASNPSCATTVPPTGAWETKPYWNRSCVGSGLSETSRSRTTSTSSQCYLQELDSEQPAPDWTVMLGVTKNADSPPSPDLSQAQLRHCAGFA